MPPNPKDNPEIPFERSGPIRAKDQLQPPYPQTLKFAQPRGDEGIVPQTNASPQSHTGDTRHSSSEGSAKGPATYLSARRAWGKNAQGDKASSAVDYSPMSNWEHGAGLDEPWNGVGEVSAGVHGGKRSVKRSQSGNPVLEKESDCATKGSSKQADSAS